MGASGTAAGPGLTVGESNSWAIFRSASRAGEREAPWQEHLFPTSHCPDLPREHFSLVEGSLRALRGAGTFKGHFQSLPACWSPLGLPPPPPPAPTKMTQCKDSWARNGLLAALAP